MLNNYNKLILTFSISILCLGILVWNGCKKSELNIQSIDSVFNNQPWAKVIPQLKPVKGVGGVKASDCGNCHIEIYEEWKTSTHSQALSDLQFQSELSKDSSPKWICLNCHIPIQNQREEILIGLENGQFRKPVSIPNPDFDPEMQKEAVTCATCHIRQDESGESYVLGANGNTDPPHPVRIDKEALRNRCQDCHNAEYNLDESLICYFRTGEEMASDSSLPDNQKYCSNCHLPEIKRSFVKKSLGKPIRVSHNHSFWGGGVPKTFELYKHLPRSGYSPALKMKILSIQEEENQYILELELTNTNPAHKLTTGDPERHLLIETNVEDKKGNHISGTKTRIGQEWEWWPKAKLIHDKRLLPLETRKQSIVISKEPSEIYSKNELRFIVTASHVRLTEENANFMKERYNLADPPYAEKIKNLDKHYPYSTKIIEIRTDYHLRSVHIKNWKELNHL